MEPSTCLSEQLEEGCCLITEQYHYVLQHYDRANWSHHFALIIAICFMHVVSNICFRNEDVISSSDSISVTEEIHQIEWIEWVLVQSTYHKGTVSPLPFLVMMLSALIGFWDSQSPLAKHLRSHQNFLGKHWTDKHGELSFYHLSHFNDQFTILSCRTEATPCPAISFDWA